MSNLSADDYQRQIDGLREELGCDFVSLAFAQSATDGFVITWQYASGNLNDRFKRIVLQPGKGLAGYVYKTGKPIFVADVRKEINASDLFNYPIIMSEQLHSLATIPLFQADRVAGVFLAGYREENKLTKEVMERLRQALDSRFDSFGIKEAGFQ